MDANDQMLATFREAKSVLAAADRHADALARLITGRLRHVHPSVLAEMKRELRTFNAGSRRWKK